MKYGLSFVLFALMIAGCKKDNNNDPIVTPGKDAFKDSRDNRVYKYVKIGIQTWMAENLAWLPAVNAPSDGSGTEPCYYVYGYVQSSVNGAKATTNYATYGVLYNWVAATTACPNGWHLPSDAEWTTLTDYLTNNGYGFGGIESAIGKSLAATSGWLTCASEGAVGNDQVSNNTSGFAALPGGYRTDAGEFNIFRVSASFWSSSRIGASYAWYRNLFYDYPFVHRFESSRSYGLSVRCLEN